MEKYIVRKLTDEDEYTFEEFIFEHIANDEQQLVFENSLITGKNYIKYSSFKEWNKIHQLLEKSSDGKVQANNYLVFIEKNNRLKLVSIFEIRTNLPSNMSNIGNISIGVRPSEREKGYYTKTLSCALSEAQKLGLDKIVLTCSMSDEKSIHVIKKTLPNMEISSTEDMFEATYYIKKNNIEQNNEEKQEIINEKIRK